MTENECIKCRRFIPSDQHLCDECTHLANGNTNIILDGGGNGASSGDGFSDFEIKADCLEIDSDSGEEF